VAVANSIDAAKALMSDIGKLLGRPARVSTEASNSLGSHAPNAAHAIPHMPDISPETRDAVKLRAVQVTSQQQQHDGSIVTAAASRTRHLIRLNQLADMVRVALYVARL
jgi:hypothetical protein